MRQRVSSAPTHVHRRRNARHGTRYAHGESMVRQATGCGFSFCIKKNSFHLTGSYSCPNRGVPH
ncbi:hypothetical protein LMH71_04695 [Enterovibrio norvegicus]|nr:hypothetical protein [Enterovibrio norvegicus]